MARPSSNHHQLLNFCLVDLNKATQNLRTRPNNSDRPIESFKLTSPGWVYIAHFLLQEHFIPGLKAPSSYTASLNAWRIVLLSS